MQKKDLLIGTLKLRSDRILAPLAGINDIAFRRLCSEHGAGLVYTGMINANALVRANKATLRLIETCEEERPVGIQLFGTKADVMIEAAKIAQQHCDLIDINMGCPDKNVIRQGAGGALLRRPKKVAQLVSSLSKAISVPLTVKIRSGIEKHDPDATLKLAKIIEENGAAALTIHPRTVNQGYSGRSDWNIIRQVKDHLSIPVIGNGDIRREDDIASMQKMTGCDLVMIGRAAMGNPFIFSAACPTLKDIRACYQRYLEYAFDYNIHKVSYLRMQGQFFFKGFEGSAMLRQKLGKVRTIDELRQLIS